MDLFQIENTKEYAGQPITRQVLMHWLRDYKRPYDKIHEMVRQQELIQVKRGLFIPGPKLRITQPEPFLLANHIYGPSYVSMESALSHWQMIPERVYEITSVTPERSTSFVTPVGRFSYTHLPKPWYAYGQQSVQLAPRQVVLMASAEKALCDKIVATSGLLFRSTIRLKEWLTEDMRMESATLRSLNINTIKSWLPQAPKRQSLELLVKTLEEI